MSVNDGTGDGQPHPDSIDLRGVKSLENPLEMCWIDARPGITHRDQYCICLGLLGADQQRSAPSLNRAHGFNCVKNQIQDYLLQLNTICQDGDQVLRKTNLERDIASRNCASRQPNHFIDRLVEIKTLLSGRCLFDVVMDPVNDLPGPIGIVNDTIERFPDLDQVWWQRL